MARIVLSFFEIKNSCYMNYLMRKKEYNNCKYYEDEISLNG